jgi:2-succinyl-6-hydroxy-2,4-cyclohexadiene-1-carboxylate synthase
MDRSHVTLVHGFTQTGASWGEIAARLEAAGFSVTTPDVPAARDLWEAAGALASGDRRGHWIGYSMGGRIALHVALASPGRVERLVVVGATGGIDDPVDRATRRASDEGLAAMAERVGVAAFLDHWLAQPLFATLPPEGQGRAARLANSPELLANHLRRLGTGSQEPLWPRLAELAMPVLVVVGERDAKFTALGNRLVAAIGDNAALAVVPDAGHACHLERPEAFVDIVVPWLQAGAAHSASPTASSTP